MSSNLKINPILAESIMPAHSPRSVTVTVDGTACTPSDSTVAIGGDVTLISKTGSNIRVFTHVSGSLTDVFNEPSPYIATTGSGTKYTLKSSVTGKVSFDLTDPVPVIAPALGGNGTINVGG
jgi:hypothetical protein